MLVAIKVKNIFKNKKNDDDDKLETVQDSAKTVREVSECDRGEKQEGI